MVIDALRRTGRTGERLDGLRRLRNAADYELATENTRTVATRAVGTARFIYPRL